MLLRKEMKDPKSHTLESGDHSAEEKMNVNISRILEVLYVGSKYISDKKYYLIQLRSASNLDISSSEEELKSLLSTVITNAVKYVLPKGRIHVTWYRGDNDRAMFGVSDMGISITKAHLFRITEYFYHIDKTCSRESGSGVGLRLSENCQHALAHRDSAFIY